MDNSSFADEVRNAPDSLRLYMKIGRGWVQFFRRKDDTVWAVPCLPASIVAEELAAPVDTILGLREAKDMIEFLLAAEKTPAKVVELLKVLRPFSIDMVAALRGGEEIRRLRDELWKAKLPPIESQKIKDFLQEMQIWRWDDYFGIVHYEAIYSGFGTHPTLVTITVPQADPQQITDESDLVNFPSVDEFEEKGATRVF